MSQFWRSRDGRTIHAVTCRYRYIPWHWSTGRDRQDIAATIQRLGYRTCRLCKPLDGFEKTSR